jgi:hypothetical protein
MVLSFPAGSPQGVTEQPWMQLIPGCQGSAKIPAHRVLEAVNRRKNP